LNLDVGLCLGLSLRDARRASVCVYIGPRLDEETDERGRGPLLCARGVVQRGATLLVGWVEEGGSIISKDNSKKEKEKEKERERKSASPIDLP